MVELRELQEVLRLLELGAGEGEAHFHGVVVETPDQLLGLPCALLLILLRVRGVRTEEQGHRFGGDAVTHVRPPPDVRLDQDLVVHQVERRQSHRVVPLGLVHAEARVVELHQPRPDHPLPRGSREAEGQAEVDGRDGPLREAEVGAREVGSEQRDVVRVDPHPLERFGDVLLSQQNRDPRQSERPPQDKAYHLPMPRLKGRRVGRLVRPLVQHPLVPYEPPLG